MIVAILATFNLQCAWTPEIETVLHEGPECFISLKTSPTLNMVPKHPVSLPESLIEEILTGMAISQEEGILQQLLLSTHLPVPAFSPSQIDLLAPQMSMAFSQVTPEEIIYFKCPTTAEQSFRVEGTLAVFPPTILLLTLKDFNSSPGISPKIQNGSPKFHTTTSLTFSHQEAIIRAEEVQAFMTIPSTSKRIAINYQRLASSNQNNKENQLHQHGPSATHDKKTAPPVEMDSLSDQLRDLRKIVDQQAEEIRRLLRNSPP